MKNAFGNEHENTGGFSIHDYLNDREFSGLHSRGSNKKLTRAEKSMASTGWNRERFHLSDRTARNRSKILEYSCLVNVFIDPRWNAWTSFSRRQSFKRVVYSWHGCRRNVALNVSKVFSHDNFPSCAGNSVHQASRCHLSHFPPFVFDY